MDDGEYWAGTGLLELADAQGYLDGRIVLIYAGRSIQELVRILNVDREAP